MLSILDLPGDLHLQLVIYLSVRSTLRFPSISRRSRALTSSRLPYIKHVRAAIESGSVYTDHELYKKCKNDESLRVTIDEIWRGGMRWVLDHRVVVFELNEAQMVSMIGNAVKRQDILNLTVFFNAVLAGRCSPSLKADVSIEAALVGSLPVVVRLLADPMVDPSTREDRALRHAAENGHLATVQALLADPRVDPGSGDALWAACAYEHIEVVRVLLADDRVDVAAVSNHCVRTCCDSTANADILELLLRDRRIIGGGLPTSLAGKLRREAEMNGLDQIAFLLMPFRDRDS